MMSENLRVRIADIPRRHEHEPDAIRCKCGHAFDSKIDQFLHLADSILALPGIAVVELPEPDLPSWSDGVVTAVGDRVELDGHSMTPATARQLAAELLAAANRADNHVR